MRGWYKPWPRILITLPNGYIEMSYDFMVRGPRKKVNKILTIAKENNGWRLIDMRIVFFQFRNITVTLARFIEDAGSYLSKKPVKMDTGTLARHPGRECNVYLKKIAKDAGSRISYRYERDCVFQVNCEEGMGKTFAEYAMNKGILHSSSIKKGMLDVYTPEGARIIIAAMKEDPNFTIPQDMIEFNYDFSQVELSPCSKTLRKQRDVPKGKTLLG